MRLTKFKYHSNLKHEIILTIALCSGLFILEVLWGLYYVSILLQFFLPLFWISIFALVIKNFIEIFRLWPSKHYLAVVPFLIALFSLFAADDVQHLTKILHFKYYRNDFEQIVEMIETGQIDIYKKRIDAQIPIPNGLLPKCYSMHAFNPNSDTLTVLFYLGGGFPCKHNGVLFTNDSPPTIGMSSCLISKSNKANGKYYLWSD